MKQFIQFGPRTFYLGLESDDGEWQFHIHETYDENGIRWTIAGATVMVSGIISDFENVAR